MQDRMAALQDRFNIYTFDRITWSLLTRYEPTSFIGHGAFGQVLSAVDTLKGSKVAIKKFTRPFETSEDAKRVFREIYILRLFSEEGQSPDVIELLDLFSPQGTAAEFTELYLATNLMPADLHRVIYSQSLPEPHIGYIMYQILRGLKYLHSAKIIHRDLKPSNIAIDGECKVKILDLGLARSKVENDTFLTKYVQTRWYRAPEVLLEIPYDGRSDVWSVGCIFAEAMNRAVLLKGKDSADQMRLIIQQRGYPSQNFISSIDNPHIVEFLHRYHECAPKALHAVLPSASEQGRQFFDILMSYEDRPSAADALELPFLQEHHDPNQEPIYLPGEIDASFEEHRTKEAWREMIFNEVHRYRQLHAPIEQPPPKGL